MSEAERKNYLPEKESGRRVLVAEDSSITQDLLKLVLNQRGHEADIVSDGKEALEALKSQNYDVALLDFHLPEMDGVQVVSGFLENRKSKKRPYFVAITADVEGLLEHTENCEKFDKIIPKPVDIQEVCSVIDTCQVDEDAASFEASGRSVTPGPSASPAQPAKRVETSSSPVFSLDYNYLCWPDDLNSKHVSARALQASVTQDSFDAIVIKERAEPADLVTIWQTKTLHLLPVIDLAGSLGKMADINCSALGFNETEEVRTLIEAFHDRRAYVHRDLVNTDEMSDKLLGRIFMANAPLTPSYDARSDLLASYNVTLDARFVINEAKKLADGGFLVPSFFDRVHQCGGCGSSHFNVREECPECRSSNLSEEPYLHHFRCAYQGPESDFRHGDDLICPKCRREIGHFGRDYDKPGTMVICGSCGHTTSEPMVGFCCVSCGTHTDGDAIQTRDVYSYAMSEQGIGYIEAGQAFLGFAQQTLRFSELPLDLVVALNDEARRYNDGGEKFALLDIAYQNEREITREHGPRQYNDARKLALENLRRALSENAKVVRGQAYDFALLKNTDPDDIRAQTEKLSELASDQIRFDMGITITVFGPEDLSR